jgi:cytidine diphosphoramidate kinase
MVIWITGMSGAGKTTASRALEAVVKPRVPELFLVDGDAVRELFGSGLGFAEADRVEQITRMRKLAGFIAAQGQLVVVAALYCNPDLLAENRRTLPEYFEVYLRTPMDVLRARDTKGLYAGAAAGRIPNVVGVDIPWHEPQQPDLVLDSGSGATPEDFAREIMRHVPRLRDAMAVGV